MDFSKIPLLKDIDFTDPIVKKKAIILAFGIVIMVGLFIYISMDGNESPAINDNRITSTSTPALDVQYGEDNDDLDRKDNRRIFQSGDGKSLARKLFEKDTIDTDDPLAGIGMETEAQEEQKQENQDDNIIRPGSANVYGELKLKELKESASKKDEVMDEIEEGRKKREEEEAKKRQERLAAIGGYQSTNAPTPPSQSAQAVVSSPIQQEPDTPKQSPVSEPEVIINNDTGYIDDDNSFGLGTTSINSISSPGKMSESLALKVMFSEDKKVKTGDRVQLRLCEEKGITVNGIHIPKNTLLFATVNIGSRVEIKVSSINLNGQIIPLNYEAYDNDGEKGIYCPQNLTEEALRQAGQEAKQVASTTLQSIMGVFGARAVSSGTSASDKLTQNQSVYITSGYTFYLMRQE